MAAALSRGDVAKADIWRGFGGCDGEPWSLDTGGFTPGIPLFTTASLATNEDRGDGVASSPHPAFAIVSFTAATSWLSVNGFGRKSNCWPSGRLFSKASSA